MTEHHYELSEEERFITLDKLLKRMNLVGSGSEARAAIVDGMVSVNGNVESQGRKEVKAGDDVIFNGNSIQVS
ncbi:RNA-binding S4 domain-containing protein [Cryomorphaceae bacterium 1068]|nr:RNA-binding S4 domain-containing protein [Cryomorphaceae bacterium 1068]